MTTEQMRNEKNWEEHHHEAHVHDHDTPVRQVRKKTTTRKKITTT